MKNFNRQAAAFTLSLSMLAASAAPVLAEGSKEMVSIPEEDTAIAGTSGTEAYRPYLEWRDRNQFNMPSKNVINVYANEGETILFGSSVEKANDRSIQAVVEKDIKFTSSLDTTGQAYSGASIAVTLPSSDNTAFDPTDKGNDIFVSGSDLSAEADKEKVYLFNVTKDGEGYIANPTEEKNGPNGVNGQTEGYEPLSFTAPYTGTYSFRFLSPEYTESDLMPTAAPISIEEEEVISSDFSNMYDKVKNNPSDLSKYPESVDVTAANEYIKITQGTGGSKTRRGWIVNNKEKEIGGKTYSYWLESNKNTTNSAGYISINPKHYPNKIRIKWGFNADRAGRQRGVFLNNKQISKKTSTQEGEEYYETEISNLTPNEESRMHFTELGSDQKDGKTQIYSIEYIYDKNSEEMDAGATIPPVPTREPLDRTISEQWANSPAEVAAWDVTVAEVSGTASPEPTASPTETPAAKAIVWDFIDLDSLNTSKPESVIADDNKTNITVNNGEYSKDRGIKLNKIGEKFDKNYFSFKPQYSGTLKINAAASTDTNAVICVKQGDKEQTVLTVGKTYTGSEEASVEANTEVYIYTTGGNAYFKTITFTPSYTAAALAAETSVSSGTTYTAKTGRVWADVMFLNAGAYKRSIYPQLNVLTQDGFLYNLKLNGIQPYGFLLYSNNRGFLFDNYKLYTDGGNTSQLTPLEHSFFSKGNSDVGTPPVRNEVDSNGNPIVIDNKQVQSTILGNYEPTDKDRDFTHKMFFNTPDSEALKAYTGNESLKTENDFENEAAIVLNNLVYTGKGNYQDNEGNTHYGTMGVGGDFKVTLEDEDIKKLNALGAKNISVTLDFSGYKLDDKNKPITAYNNDKKRYEWQTNSGDEESDAEKNNIVTITATIIDGTKEYILSWDGMDAYGNAVPAGEYGNNIKSYVEMGMAHFPILDAEHNPNGIKIKMVNEIGNITDRDKVYYNNQAESPRINSNASTVWYYANQDKDKYPKQIGDGLNKLGGVSSNFSSGESDGAMKFGDYEDDEPAKNQNTEWGYGNFTALDIWTKYEVNQKASVTVGVKEPEQVNAYLSFVAENGEITPSSTDTPFNKSHLKYAGSLIKEDSSVRGESEIYGNTISTGFRTNIKIDSSAADKYINWEVTIPNPSNTENNKLGESYIKIPEGTNESDSVIEAAELYNSLFGVFEEEEKPDVDNFTDDAAGDEISSAVSDVTDNAVDMGNNTDDEITSFGDEQVQFLLESEENDSSDSNKGNYLEEFSYDANNPVITDSDGTTYNKGKIYKFNGFSGQSTNLKIKLRQKIGTLITASEGTTFDISVGLVIDNLYAPNATAAASYGDSTVDEVLNAIGASSYQNYLSNENTIGYNPESNKNYKNK